jgi:hypothetical protein
MPSDLTTFLLALSKADRDAQVLNKERAFASCSSVAFN